MLVRRAQKGSRLTAAEYDENQDSIARATVPILTINAGVITIPSSGVYPAPGVYYVLPQSGTADDLTQINGALGHEEEIILRTSTVGHVITVIHSGTNLCMSTSTFLLNSIKDHISFRARSVNVWVEHSRLSIVP